MIRPIVILAMLLWSFACFAQGTRYEMRVDGLACPFCAYGIEKQFTQVEGVKSFDIDMAKGLVIVTTEEGVQFSEEELAQIIHDAGFTMRGVTEKSL